MGAAVLLLFGFFKNSAGSAGVVRLFNVIMNLDMAFVISLGEGAPVFSS